MDDICQYICIFWAIDTLLSVFHARQCDTTSYVWSIINCWLPLDSIMPSGYIIMPPYLYTRPYHSYGEKWSSIGTFMVIMSLGEITVLYYHFNYFCLSKSVVSNKFNSASTTCLGEVFSCTIFALFLEFSLKCLQYKYALCRESTPAGYLLHCITMSLSFSHSPQLSLDG